jgi:hypothetical protein
LHRRLLEQLLLGTRQCIQTGSDHALHRFRQLAGRPAFGEHADVLLCEQRVTARSFEQHSLLLSKLKWLLQQLGDQARRVIVGERSQRDRGRVWLPTSPPLAPVQQLRAGRPNDQKRNPAEPVDEVVEEVQQAVVSPVQVLEHEYGRSALGNSLEKATPRRHRGLRAGGLPTVARDPNEGA